MQDKRVLVKGCSDFSIPENAYVELVEKLRPIVKSLMFGEACSNVPIFKNKCQTPIIFLNSLGKQQNKNTMSLLDLITGNTGNQVAEQAENKMGISKSQIIALLAVAAPLVISYLRNKSKNAADAEALNNALDKDHDGSILNDPSQALNRQDEGGSILNHVFGSDKQNVENQLSQSTGISMDKIGGISNACTNYYGIYRTTKQANNTGAGGLGDLLGGIMGMQLTKHKLLPETQSLIF